MFKRVISLITVFSLVLSAAAARVGYIMLSGNYRVSSGYNSYTLNIDKIYPTIYYNNLIPVTNTESKYVAIIRPNEKCISELNNYFTHEEISDIKKELSKGYPVIREINSIFPCKNIQIFETVKRYDDANILIKSASAHFNDVVGEKKINFTVDARGRMLDGDFGSVIENNYNTTCGAVLTVDSEIQKIAEDAASKMEKGTVIILDVNTNEIKALCSKPNDTINRSFTPCSVGSVFKLVVAAAAAESYVNLNYTCSGKIKIGDTEFSCQNDRKHGNQDLKNALANSCNTYFVNLALFIGADKILDTARRLGLESDIDLGNDWIIESGNLPNEQELTSKGQLSLFGFGQGALTTTPLQFACAVSAFANGGYYIEPSVISGYVDSDGAFSSVQPNKKVKVLNNKTAETIRKYMRYVVTKGTGRSAEYNDSSAGKTSTAQTGKFVGDKEILTTWFAGFYPYSNPKYSIVIVTEDGRSGSTDCCPIFRTIVEKLENK